MKIPNFEIVSRDARRVIIHDVGPWSDYPTVTNGTEAVVKVLYDRGLLSTGMGLYYHDSDGEFGELKRANGRFTGFGSAKESDVL